jgi:2-oxoisovalerate dehydrogenase E1 component alpha subunit
MYSSREHSFFSISSNAQMPQAVDGQWPPVKEGDTRIAATWVSGLTAGDFHSACCAVYNAPVIIWVNNQWAISSFSGFAGAERTTFAARALGYGITWRASDGNDPLAVYAAGQMGRQPCALKFRDRH